MVHLKSKKEKEKRLEEFKELIYVINKEYPSRDVFIIGDFNAEQGEIQQLLKIIPLINSKPAPEEQLERQEDGALTLDPKNVGQEVNVLSLKNIYDNELLYSTFKGRASFDQKRNRLDFGFSLRKIDHLLYPHLIF